MSHYCNPMDIEYPFQYFHRPDPSGKTTSYKVYREAADPTLILFKDTYFLFPSMTQGFYTSADLYQWEFYKFGPEVPMYDYAPDVRVMGDYIYFSASKRGENCSFYRTKDPRTEAFEEMKSNFEWWDPNLFIDDDGRVYFYWGCSNIEPIYGVELDSETMLPIGERQVMISPDTEHRGYERFGEEHIPPKTEEEIEATVNYMLEQNIRQAGETGQPLPCSVEELRQALYGYMGNTPYVEGAWMTKYNGLYYLQYAVPGTEYNVYGNAAFVGKSPLGPFELMKNNPFSYKPGGFITGAGHGSTLEDKNGNWWHIASMRISHNEPFERRLGIFKSGFDSDGQLFCDQRFADWPIDMDAKAFDQPDWMLLSYKKTARVSSGEGAENLTNEDIRDFWKAGSNKPGEWAEIDLGEVYDVRGIQVNFQEDGIVRELPEGASPKVLSYEERWLDPVKQPTRWLLEGSEGGENYFIIEDRRDTDTDYSHPFIEREGGIQVRFLKLTIYSVPYQAAPAVSGIRVFGFGKGKAPMQAADVRAELQGSMDMDVSWNAEDAIGANVLWGYAQDKLYHSRMVMGGSQGESKTHIGALIDGQSVYVRVDTFNEAGITEGNIMTVRE